MVQNYYIFFGQIKEAEKSVNTPTLKMCIFSHTRIANFNLINVIFLIISMRHVNYIAQFLMEIMHWQPIWCMV
jgi:hypothetical protein